MSAPCRKCKGAGVVPDLSWCGDETCCPRMLDCLACGPVPAQPVVGVTLEHSIEDPFTGETTVRVLL